MRIKQLSPFLALFVALMSVQMCFAHPMGNFSVNHYSKIDLQADGVRIEYFIDLAEIPAYQELQAGNLTANGDDAAVVHYIAVRGVELGHGLTLSVNGKPMPLRLRSSGVIFPPGAGGLPTMKMGFVYEGAYPAGIDRSHASLRYIDGNYAGHTGWKEIIAVASAGNMLRSSVPTKDRSSKLDNYPTDLLSGPPQSLQASLEAVLPPQNTSISSAQPLALPVPERSPADAVRNHRPVASKRIITAREVLGESKVGRSPLHPAARSAVSLKSADHASPTPPLGMMKANRQQTPRSKFTELISAQHLSLWFLITAAFIAAGLGALHALEPGHGKTIVAAYLVGSRGTARHAVLLGLIVTMSHTAGVFALGAITLWASRYIVPEQLYPWLGVLSGIAIAGLGGYMLLRRLSGTATDHSHIEGQGHWLFFNRGRTDSADESRLAEEKPTKPVSLTQLFTLGITGGIIPCPAALIVLLSALALHRIALGFFLIVAFSLGLAVVLMGFGLMMVYAGRLLSHLQIDGPLTKRWLPVASSAFITILGFVIALQGLAAVNIHFHDFSKEKIGPLLFVTGLGLILGMRHSTDADHVVAISTIVSKQRSIRNAAFIGSVWGLGHTITIFIVGSLIILFGVEIPPRVGLSMEFSVAVMLVILGLLNLTGTMQKITKRYFPMTTALSDVTPEVAVKRLANPIECLGIYQCVRPLVIGLVHGLAGSAAVALLVLSTIHDPRWATIYLLIFGAGTMVGMMCMTAAMAVPLTYAGNRFVNLSRYLGVASGLASLCFGCFLVYQLGFLGGLFTSHPQWTAR